MHIDKDMAEIGCVREVWPDSKIQLCWWHLRRAIRERFGKNKLSTTPYLARRARAEFSFIELIFKPRTRSDKREWEGGKDDFADSLVANDKQHGPNALLVTLPPPSQPLPSASLTTETPDITAPSSQLPRVRLVLTQPQAPRPMESAEGVSEDEEVGDGETEPEHDRN